MNKIYYTMLFIVMGLSTSHAAECPKLSLTQASEIFSSQAFTDSNSQKWTLVMDRIGGRSSSGMPLVVSINLDRLKEVASMKGTTIEKHGDNSDGDGMCYYILNNPNAEFQTQEPFELRLNP